MNNQRKILISGTSSGLGKYLYKKIGTHKYNRKTQPSYYQKIKWDLIVHCGFYAGEDITKAIESIRHSYLISKLKSQKIIFISSLIVYENSSNTLENTKLYIKKNSSLYNKSKILSESFFNKKNMIILRVGTLIGKYMKKNNIYKILYYKNPILSLTKESTYSFVDHEEIFQFIEKNNNFEGILNFNRSDYINLISLSKKIKKKFNYGKFYFNCIKANNTKINKYLDLKNTTSIKLLKKYCRNYEN